MVTAEMDIRTMKLLDELKELESRTDDVGPRPTAEDMFYACDAWGQMDKVVRRLQRLHPDDYQDMIDNYKRPNRKPDY